MGTSDWSMERLEQDLSSAFALLDRAEDFGALRRGESAALAEGVLRCMNGALQKVSESLEAQSRLRRDFDRAREEFRESQAAQSRRIRALEDEVRALREALARERGRGGDESCARSAAAVEPPADLLRRPLVLRSRQGDFLGVTDSQGRALTMSGFLSLVERGGGGGRVVASCWERASGGWALSLGLCSGAARGCYGLEVQATRTPSGNKVTVLNAMRMDGSPVSGDYMVRMFRQLRECFQEE